jgi:hypothetical protein
VGSRYLTPTGDPCPRVVRVDGTVLGSGDCLGCGTCLLFGGLLDASAWLEQPTAAHGAVGGDEDHRVDEEADEEA